MLSSFEPVQHSFDKFLSTNYQSSGPILLILHNSGDQICSWVLVARFDANKSKTYMLIYVVCISMYKYVHSIYSLFSKRSSKYDVVLMGQQSTSNPWHPNRKSNPTHTHWETRHTRFIHAAEQGVQIFCLGVALTLTSKGNGNDVSKWTTDSSCWWLQPFWIVWSSKSLQLRLW